MITNLLNTINHLIENYEIILNSLKVTCIDIDRFSQIRKPMLSNLDLATINLTAEYMPINTELQLFRCMKGTYLVDP